MKLACGLLLVLALATPCLSEEMNVQAKTDFDEAFQLAKKGDYVAAVLKYESALKAAPESQWIWQEYAICLKNLNRLQRATQAGWRALELGKETQALWGNLGNVFLRARAWDAAMAAYQKAEALAENKPSALKNFANLGYYAWIAGADDKAEAALQYARKLDPEDYQALMDLGFLHASAGKVEQGKTEIQQALEAARKDPQAESLVKYTQLGLNEIQTKGKIHVPADPAEVHYQALPDRFLTQPQKGEAKSLNIDPMAITFLGVPGGGRIAIQVPEDWGQVREAGAVRGVQSFRFLAPREDAFTILITPFPVSKIISDLDLKAEVEKSGEKNLAGAVEQKIAVIEVRSDSMRGYVYRMTDKNSVGKPAQKGDYPYMIQGMFAVGGVPGGVTVLSRTDDTKFTDEILACLKSMTYEKR
jgi:tetratricopeptide (TPR) repeat protein